MVSNTQTTHRLPVFHIRKRQISLSETERLHLNYSIVSIDRI